MEHRYKATPDLPTETVYGNKDIPLIWQTFIGPKLLALKAWIIVPQREKGRRERGFEKEKGEEAEGKGGEPRLQ